jgi:hypothetical protein
MATDFMRMLINAVSPEDFNHGWTQIDTDFLTAKETMEGYFLSEVFCEPR